MLHENLISKLFFSTIVKERSKFQHQSTTRWSSLLVPKAYSRLGYYQLEVLAWDLFEGGFLEGC